MGKRFLLYAWLLAALTACGTSQAALNEGKDEVNASKTLQLKEKDNTGYTNIYDYIKSRVPGLQVKGESIYIRGVNSVNSQAAPLILVDGMEVQDVSGINPQDVAIIEVIKDSSTALYGFRGVGGVIKITTKAGQKQ